MAGISGGCPASANPTYDETIGHGSMRGLKVCQSKLSKIGKYKSVGSHRTT